MRDGNNAMLDSGLHNVLWVIPQLVLHQAFGQAVRWEMITSNPVDGAQLPRPRRPEFTAIDLTPSNIRGMGCRALAPRAGRDEPDDGVVLVMSAAPIRPSEQLISGPHTTAAREISR